MNAKVKNPSVTYTNNQVAIGKDLVFTWIVLGEEGWVPLSQLSLEDLATVEKAMDHNRIFPDELYAYLRQLIDGLKAA